MHLSIPLATALLTASPAYAASYKLVQNWQGNNFFSGWDFYGSYDNLTNGDVVWVDQPTATSSKLAYIDGNNAIIKVDNTAFVPYNEKRNSVRITTQEFFPIGTVLIMDVNHLPWGCSVWPSIWTHGPNWPKGGEIDIIEGVNKMTFNQMALHTDTGGGCTAADGAKQSGQLTAKDCGTVAGCTVVEKQPNSYGDAFNNAGGGVWALQLDTDGVNIWFWTRNSIPAAVSGAGDTVDPSSWGTPSAAYPSSSCDIAKSFTPQQIVIDITLCGDWAGLPSVYKETCGGDGSQPACYVDNVINEGAKFNDAFFSIAYLKAFTADGTVIKPTQSGGSTVLETAKPTDGAAGPTPPNNSTDPNGAQAVRAFAGAAGAVVAGAFGAFFL